MMKQLFLAAILSAASLLPGATLAEGRGAVSAMDRLDRAHSATSQYPAAHLTLASVMVPGRPVRVRHSGLRASLRPVVRPAVQPLPDLRWDHIEGSDTWTRAAMQALNGMGDPIVQTVPRDIGAWCPGYPAATKWERKAFWAGLLSAMAKHESTYRPKAVGGGGKWYGLVQILPATARGYGCTARTGEALMDGALNMACAVRILAVTVPRDGVVSAGMRGVAADWGPFHSEHKREDMRRWISTQPYCESAPADLAAVRPVPRPARRIATLR
jgi:hypothetical protein